MSLKETVALKIQDRNEDTDRRVTIQTRKM